MLGRSNAREMQLNKIVVKIKLSNRVFFAMLIQCLRIGESMANT